MSDDELMGYSSQYSEEPVIQPTSPFSSDIQFVEEPERNDSRASSVDTNGSYRTTPNVTSPMANMVPNPANPNNVAQPVEQPVEQPMEQPTVPNPAAINRPRAESAPPNLNIQPEPNNPFYQQLERDIAEILSQQAPVDVLNNGNIPYLSIPEQIKILELGFLLYNPQSTTRNFHIFSKMYELISNPNRSALVHDLFSATDRINIIRLLRTYASVINQPLLSAILRICQVSEGLFKLDEKTMRTTAFTKNIIAKLTYKESYDIACNKYFSLQNSNTSIQRLNFSDHKLLISKLSKQHHSKMERYTETAIPLVLIPSSEIHDSEIINPLRSFISTFYLKSALFLELNNGITKKVFNRYARLSHQ